MTLNSSLSLLGLIPGWEPHHSGVVRQHHQNLSETIDLLVYGLIMSCNVIDNAISRLKSFLPNKERINILESSAISFKKELFGSCGCRQSVDGTISLVLITLLHCWRKSVWTEGS
jgi:hypothetical protein